MSARPVMTTKQLYRSYLQHLRHLPDPHTWAVLPYRFRGVLRTAREASVDDDRQGSSSGTTRRELRAKRATRMARKEMDKLRAAVSGHPHALLRLLQEAYGQRGAVKWSLVNNVRRTWLQPDAEPPLTPAPLVPFLPKPIPPQDRTERAKAIPPDTAVRKDRRDKIRRDRTLVRSPLVLPQPPGSTAGTGWEGRGVPETLRILAGVDHEIKSPSAHLLPTFAHMPAHLKRIFPQNPDRHLRGVELYPRPPPRATRANPGTWTTTTGLTPRLLQRTYRKLWDSLTWSRPVNSVNSEEGGERWVASTWRAMNGEKGDTPLTRLSKKQKQKGLVEGVRPDDLSRFDKVTDAEAQWL